LARALGSALRALNERIALAKKLHEEAATSGRTEFARSWASRAREVEREADVIRASIRRVDEIAAQLASHQ